jgi:hypothetical protein
MACFSLAPRAYLKESARSADFIKKLLADHMVLQDIHALLSVSTHPVLKGTAAVLGLPHGGFAAMGSSTVSATEEAAVAARLCKAIASVLVKCLRPKTKALLPMTRNQVNYYAESYITAQVLLSRAYNALPPLRSVIQFVTEETMIEALVSSAGCAASKTASHPDLEATPACQALREHKVQEAAETAASIGPGSAAAQEAAPQVPVEAAPKVPVPAAGQEAAPQVPVPAAGQEAAPQVSVEAAAQEAVEAAAQEAAPKVSVEAAAPEAVKAAPKVPATLNGDSVAAARQDAGLLLQFVSCSGPNMVGEAASMPVVNSGTGQGSPSNEAKGSTEACFSPPEHSRTYDAVGLNRPA